MDVEPSSLTLYFFHGSLPSYIFLIFPIILFIFILFSLIPFLTFFLKKKYFPCKCEICHSYMTSSWSQSFPNLCDWYTYLLQNSPTKTIHIHVLDNIITANHENVEHMLKTNFDNYPKGKTFSSILGDLLGNGIFNVDGDSWRFQRKMVSLEFDKHSVRSFSCHVVMKELDQHLLPYLSKQVNGSRIVDLQETFRAFSFTTICQFSFGVEVGELKGVSTSSLEEFSTSFDMASRLSAMRALEVCSIIWKVKRFLGIGMEKRLKDAIKKVDALAMEVIRLRRRKVITSNNNNNNSQKDLLSRSMRTVVGNKDQDKHLRDIVVSFLLAGRDTVASALTSFFWLMAKHPQVESTILLEADKVLGQDQGLGRLISNLEQVRDELQYLQATIYESMRLYPPVQFDSKFPLNCDILPDGTRVNKGDRVTYHPYAMGRMKHLWGNDCLEFKPERWLNKHKDGVLFFHQINPYKYPVFQAGVRVCLGKEMALMEIKCVILALLREFRFELPSHIHGNSNSQQVPIFSPGLTATFKGGLPVIVHRRTTK